MKCAQALAGLAVLLAILTTATPVEGYTLPKPRPWPGPHISYHQFSGDRWVVREAARAWNHRRIPIRFVAAGSADAQVHVRYGGRGCGGYFTPGRPAQVALSRRVRGCSRRHMVAVASHELGHVLGLGHEDRGCAIMNSYLEVPPWTPRGRRAGSSGPCSPARIRRDDVAGVRRLYATPYGGESASR